MIDKAQFEGRWKEPQGTPYGELKWQAPAKTGLQTYTAVAGGKIVATLKKNLHHNIYIVRVTGWVWDKPAEDSVAAKINIIEPEAKAFQGLLAAKMAVIYAMERLPANSDQKT